MSQTRSEELAILNESLSKVGASQISETGEEDSTEIQRNFRRKIVELQSGTEKYMCRNKFHEIPIIISFKSTPSRQFNNPNLDAFECECGTIYRLVRR